MVSKEEYANGAVERLKAIFMVENDNLKQELEIVPINECSCVIIADKANGGRTYIARNNSFRYANYCERCGQYYITSNAFTNFIEWGAVKFFSSVFKKHKCVEKR